MVAHCKLELMKLIADFTQHLCFMVCSQLAIAACAVYNRHTVDTTHIRS